MIEARPIDRALRALWDCGIVRASHTHPGYEGLEAKGFATSRTATFGKSDFRMTAAGKFLAQRLFE